MAVEEKPDVVQALPIETEVSFPVTNSFYEDVKTELKIDPETYKQQDQEFEDELQQQVSSLHETARLYTAPPSITNRGPLPKAKEVEE